MTTDTSAAAPRQKMRADDLQKQIGKTIDELK